MSEYKAKKIRELFDDLKVFIGEHDGLVWIAVDLNEIH